jgi:hypothetical protein
VFRTPQDTNEISDIGKIVKHLFRAQTCERPQKKPGAVLARARLTHI